MMMRGLIFCSSWLLPLLKGIVFEGEGQVARLTVEKTFGARALTVITIRQLA
jgi:hypothetical protein